MLVDLRLEALGAGQGRGAAKRVGRGIGSGHGKTSCKGHKGQKARSGGVKGPAFEGGQLPIHRRLPKRGFTNAAFRKSWQEVNVDQLGVFGEGAVVTPDELSAHGLIRNPNGRVRVLGRGECSVRIEVRAHTFSEAARRKIEGAGGVVRAIGAMEE